MLAFHLIIALASIDTRAHASLAATGTFDHRRLRACLGILALAAARCMGIATAIRARKRYPTEIYQYTDKQNR